MREKTPKLTLLQNWKTKIVTQLKKTINVTKLKNLNWDKIQTKVWQISKTKIVTKFNNLNCDKTQQLNLWQNSKTQNFTKRTISDKSLLLRTTWHLNNHRDVFEAAICDLKMFYNNVVLLFSSYFIIF